ncbi:MAG: 4-hydroxy-tetrahydrodipicolinate reductase [Myxococcota bacterium]|jgi:4-hydroxy-tetrahydrodipicolinate reductase|nr:4-hydroxy-tetrahydrodipicolinate reductase [Myxococcota bacterium]
MIRIAIHGAAGRMGQGIANACLQSPDLSVHAMLEHAAHPCIGTALPGLPSYSARLDDALGADLIVDFSHPSAISPLLDFCAKQRLRLLSGTTGIDESIHRRFAEAAEQCALLWAANTSVGVNVLMKLVAEAAEALGQGWDTELLELHHRHKRDAPSGTALVLAQLAKGNSTKQLVFSRQGKECKRADDDIAVLALRGGDVVGEHTVFFLSEGERLELSHRASHRGVLIDGAIRAARWLANKDPGLYTMRDVLFPAAESR